ncbi:hypothetical protein [Thermosipho sp. (in: thermotogales)]|uniref:hypothetical protein n=1 Tax=Thermosipho sp. (in: thermotogales) TaxID=1968895 RepID=UPI00257E50DA|nr:hypothetical protein [Thermosipho sp. (in: thermotogales)]
MKIIRERKSVVDTQYVRFFQIKEELSVCGYCFDCDEYGNLKDESLKEKFEECLKDTEQFEDKGVIELRSTYIEPAIGICDSCGAEVILEDSLTNECEVCGALYNFFGQRLLPQEQWEEN